MVSEFVVGETYSREQVADIIRLPTDRRKGNWLTGYDSWNNEIFLFPSVGVPGRTGHDYNNMWEGKQLIWSGKTKTALGQQEIDRIVSGLHTVHVFWRGKDRAPFTYAGRGQCLEIYDETPVRVVWGFEEVSLAPLVRSAKPVGVPEPLWQRGPAPSLGTRTSVLVDGPTYVYLMRLHGPVDAMFPGKTTDTAIVKIGMSTSPERRLVELNAGFPPGSAITWKIEKVVLCNSGRDAWTQEGMCLERLREVKWWIGGEFAVVPIGQIGSLLPGAAPHDP